MIFVCVHVLHIVNKISPATDEGDDDEDDEGGNNGGKIYSYIRITRCVLSV